MSIWEDIGYPDMDHDGDVDMTDAMIFDDMVEETSDNHTYYKRKYDCKIDDGSEDDDEFCDDDDFDDFDSDDGFSYDD